MNTAITTIALCASVLCVAILSFSCRRLRKRLALATDRLQLASGALAELNALRSDLTMSPCWQARVCEEINNRCFAVYRQSGTRTFDVLLVSYDPGDPDDREYKKIFATEVAEMLNHEP